MADINGTNGNDTLFFQGAEQQLTLTFTNPFSGITYTVDEEKNVNTMSYEGLAGIDTLLMSNLGDALFLANHITGARMVNNVEIFFAGEGGDVIHLASTQYSLGNITVDGGGSDDLILSSVGNDTLNGRQGDDTIDGGPGNDIVNGGAGNGINSGNDWLSGGLGNDLLRGEDGDDTLNYFADGVHNGTFAPAGTNLSNDIFDGGTGFDTLVMTGQADALFLDDPNSAFHPSGTSLRLIGVERINAGGGNDIVDLAHATLVYGSVLINGGAGGDFLRSSTGADQINGDEGDDDLRGGGGADTLNGGAGADILQGEDGDDTLVFYADGLHDGTFLAYNIGSPGVAGTETFVNTVGRNLTTDIFDGGAGFDTLAMSEAGDVLFLDDPFNAMHAGGTSLRLIGVEQINAGGGNDIVDLTHDVLSYGDIIINGGAGNDYLWASAGDDTINGGADNDHLYGGFGEDELNGDEGDDKIYGSLGNDILRGGAGNDTLYGGAGGNSEYVQIITHSHDFNNTVVFPNIQETVSIMNLVPPGTNALGIAAGDLSVEYGTTAEVSFVQTVAGYNNSLGFYNITLDGTIQSVTLAFPNVKNFSAGDAATITLPGAPDTDFGFFMIADGASQNNFGSLDLVHGTLRFMYKNNTAQERLANINDDAANIKLVYNNSSFEQVINGYTYHSTIRGDDANLNPDHAVHVVSGVMAGTGNGTLRIGFEDLPNLGDADYNDVVFDITVQDRVDVTVLEHDGDTLLGGEGNDYLDGGIGDDLLAGGAGMDTLYGDLGADTFLFQSMAEAGDIIQGFNVAEGDVINITDVLEGYDPGLDAPNAFMRLVSSGADTVLEVNADGLGSDFTALATIAGGLGGAGLNDLLASGTLVADQSIAV